MKKILRHPGRGGGVGRVSHFAGARTRLRRTTTPACAGTAGSGAPACQDQVGLTGTRGGAAIPGTGVGIGVTAGSIGSSATTSKVIRAARIPFLGCGRFLVPRKVCPPLSSL